MLQGMLGPKLMLYLLATTFPSSCSRVSGMAREFKTGSTSNGVNQRLRLSKISWPNGETITAFRGMLRSPLGRSRGRTENPPKCSMIDSMVLNFLGRKKPQHGSGYMVVRASGQTFRRTFFDPPLTPSERGWLNIRPDSSLSIKAFSARRDRSALPVKGQKPASRNITCGNRKCMARQL